MRFRDMLQAGTILLARYFDGEFAVMDAPGKAFGVVRRCLLAVRGDQLGQRQEERGLREAVPIDPIVARVHPGFLQIAERQPLLFMIGDSFVCRRNLRRNSHCIFYRRSPAAPLTAGN